MSPKQNKNTLSKICWIIKNRPPPYDVATWFIFLFLFYCFLLNPIAKIESFVGYIHQPVFAVCAADEVAPLQPLWPHEKSDLIPDPAVKFGTLNNGFRYVLLNNTEPKDRVSVHLEVQAGSMSEEDHEQGLAHFLEHLLFCGTTHFKPGKLVQYFQSIGMQFGPDANGRTGFYETVYDILLPAGDRKSLDQALLVMKDYAEGALLLPEEIDRERKVVLAEMRTRDSSSYRTFVSTLAFEFPDAKFSKRLPIGKEEIIKTLDRQRLKSFYDAGYRPDNLILVMVGDFVTHIAEELIIGQFDNLTAQAAKLPSPEFGKVAHKGLKVFYHFEKEAGYTTVSIEVLQKITPKSDSFNLQKNLLIHDVADQIVQNRLAELVRKPKAPFTSASINSGIFINQVQYAEISAKCHPNNWIDALSLIEQVLRQALTYGFTKTELERAKKEVLSDYSTALKKASTRDSKDLARSILSSIRHDRVFQSPFQKKEIFSPVVSALTLEDLNDSMNQAWAADHRLIILTGNAELSDKDRAPETQILSAYKNSHTKTVLQPEEKKSICFPYLAEPYQKGTIISHATISDLGILQIDFENGVRLNLKKTDFKANDVRISVSFGSGKSSEPIKSPGLAILSKDVINESGLGILDKEELSRAMAGKETTVVFHIKEAHFAFNAKTISDEINLAFQLIHAHIVDPGFRKEAYELVMKRFDQKYESLSHSIDGAIKLYGQRFLAGNDPRFGLPLQKEFNQLRLSDVRTWIASSLSHDAIEVSVVGDFDVDVVIESVSEYLGTLPKRQDEPPKETPSVPEFPLGKSLKVPVDTKIPKGLVVVAYPTDDIWDIRKTRRLSVLSEVVSERLRKQIREKMGAAYSLYAYNHPSRAYKGYGVLHILIQTDPSSVDQVIQEVRKITSDLAKSGVTQEELRLALGPMLTGIKDMKRKNDYWLNTVLSGSMQHPEQLEWSRTIIDDYSSITKADVSKLATQYLGNKKAATIIIIPKNQ